METVRQYPIEEVTTIQIKSALSQINVVAGAGKDIVLKWTDTQRRKTEVVLENGTLTVKDHAQAALYGIVGLIWLKEDKELTLELPTDFSGTVFLESKDECIRIVGLRCHCLLYAKSLVGVIDVSAAEFNQGEFKSQGGNIELHSVICQQSISATTVTGDIECSCPESVENYLLDCSSEHGRCSLPVFLGQGPKRLRMRSKTGSIAVNFHE